MALFNYSVIINTDDINIIKIVLLGEADRKGKDKNIYTGHLSTNLKSAVNKIIKSESLIH